MPRLAANLTTMFTELAPIERFAAARQVGFDAVEYLHQPLHPALLAGPALFVVVVAMSAAGLRPDGWTEEAMVVGGLTLWMGTWWIFEAIPLGATALLPLAVLPLAGVMPVKLVARPYMHPFILLLMAGFIAALAIERWGLHKRVALSILVRTRGGPAGLILGMMVATAMLMMGATATLMMTVMVVVTGQVVMSAMMTTTTTTLMMTMGVLPGRR